MNQRLQDHLAEISTLDQSVKCVPYDSSCGIGAYDVAHFDSDTEGLDLRIIDEKVTCALTTSTYSRSFEGPDCVCCFHTM